MSYQSNRTGADIDRILNNANSAIDDTGNITGNSSNVAGSAVSNSMNVATSTVTDTLNVAGLAELGSGTILGDEIWHDAAGNRTAASAATVVDDADFGNIGKLIIDAPVVDLNTYTRAGFYSCANSNPNNPDGRNGTLTVSPRGGGTNTTQIYVTHDPADMFIRVQDGGVWEPWQAVVSSENRTNNEANTILDDADAGNIGKSSNNATPDLQLLNVSGFFNSSNSLNSPENFGSLIYAKASETNGAQIFLSASNRVYFKRVTNGVWGNDWLEFLSSGNTGTTQYNGTITNGVDLIDFNTSNQSFITIGRVLTNNTPHVQIRNANGIVGSINSNGSVTDYNTTSDPRLKSAFSPVLAAEAWSNFDSLKLAFGKYHFLADPSKDLYGFNAHMVADLDLGMASDGEGARNLNIGDIYETIAAVMDGEEVITPEINKEVTPAGIDHSKLVPYLFAVIDDLRTRVEALENP